MATDIKNKVKALYEIMKEEKIGELEVTSKDYSVSIIRRTNNFQVLQTNQSIKVQEPVINKETQEELQKVKILNETIKSPITGVFYTSASPSVPAFVNEGDTIEVGDTICIIEAMKVMNEVKATFKTKILKVLVENATSVNLAQDLFEVKKI
jgi:acetyl-CoA carboxylase biotin carboxyl carrier protein